MISFENIPDTLTIGAIYQYTWRYLNTRFTNADRDILPSKMRIAQRRKYKRNKEGFYTTPEELLTVSSWSAPQYYPYNKIKGKESSKQMKIKHYYRIYIVISLSDGDIYSFNSKIIWRVGSYKRPVTPPQEKVKTIYKETVEKLNHKYRNEKVSVREKYIARDIKRIKKSAEYLDYGDYNSRVRGINLDNYWRDYPVQNKFYCLYGPVLNREMPRKIKMPFFCKHMIVVLHLLLKRGILKGY